MLSAYRTLLMISLIGTLLVTIQPSAAKTALPIPRFVSTRASEVNMRTGPNVRYPVRWVFVKKGEPLEIIAEFEQWRRVRDHQGDNGWVHETMLSGKRFIIIEGQTSQVIYKKPDATSNPVAKVEPETRAELLNCEKEWCRIEAGDYKGWIERKLLWGVYPDEEVK